MTSNRRRQDIVDSRPFLRGCVESIFDHSLSVNHIPRRFGSVARSSAFINPTLFRERHQTPHLPEWTGLSGAVYAHEVRIATFEFQKLVESGTSRLRNPFRFHSAALSSFVKSVEGQVEGTLPVSFDELAGLFSQPSTAVVVVVSLSAPLPFEHENPQPVSGPG
jgi:hypothetical protein